MSNYHTSLGYELPPLIMDKTTMNNKKYREAVMDAFERIGLEQVKWNIQEFDDFYKMYDGTLSYKELKMMSPQFEGLSDLLEQAELPTHVGHKDILGGVVNILVGKLIQMQDKFHATDVGEVAESDFMSFKDNLIREDLQSVIDNKIKMHFVKIGIDPQTLEKIEDPEQRQQMQQQLEVEKSKIISDSRKKQAKNAKFKTAGVVWAEATLEKDKEILDFDKCYSDLFKNYLLSGLCAKITKIVGGEYKPFNWDSRTVFHSKDIGKEYLSEFNYGGRVHFLTPTQVIEEWGDYLDFKTTRKLINGDSDWKSLSEIKNPTGSIDEVWRNQGNKSFEVPHIGYANELYMRRIEELTGLPMGEQVYFDNFGEIKSRRNWLPRGGRSPLNMWFADYVENRFPLDTNLCQVTEVYFKAMQPIGYLTYENSEGEVVKGEIVTEDILQDFIKENKIKSIKNLGFKEMIKDFEVNTIVWQYRPVSCWGVKILPSNSLEPIYLGVDLMENQINSPDVKLPLTGFVGKSLAKKLAPWQEIYNFSWNSIRSLLEKELGMFFLMNVESVPDQFMEMGDTQEAMLTLRNMAKQIGVMPIVTNPDSIGSNPFNQFSVHNVSHASEIQTRYQIAEIVKKEMYMSIGVNPTEGLTPTQYTTAEGVKTSQEAQQTQIAHIYSDFNKFIKVDLNHHILIAQHVQSNNMDKSLYYTKSDLSIAYLKNVDKNLPFRTLGIIVTDDSARAKELVQIKQAIIGRNTMDMDAKELIALTTSDTWRELMDVAEQERVLRLEQAEINHQRKMQQIKAQTEGQKMLDEEKWKREEQSKQLDRQTKIEIETIEAGGRAASKQADSQSFENIEKLRDMSLKNILTEQSINEKQERLNMKSEELAIKKRDLINKEDFKNKELALKEKEIELRKYLSDKQDQRELMNKN